jgi:peroxiredoxin
LLAALLAAAPAQAAPRQAPAFDLELFDGTTFRLSEVRGSAVVLLFWAPW